MKLIWLVGILVVISCIPVPVSSSHSEIHEKIFVIDYIFDSDTVYEESSGIWYGIPPDPGIQSGPVECAITNSQGHVLRQFYLRDPRIQYGDSVRVNPDNSTSLYGHIEYATQPLEIRIIFKYSPYYDRLTLIDTTTGKILATTDLIKAGTQIAEMFPEDMEFHENAKYMGTSSGYDIFRLPFFSN
ncbi:MAG: hypothetical protein WC342_08600 [Methanoregula sp.]|jgi:hypothetical protein